MFNPFFSIVIPTYNSTLTVNESIESIILQKFKGFEVLIIDGVSKDNTLNIVEDWQDERIKITCEKDKGIYDAMNKGIKLAKGQWLFFLGSDDVLHDENVLSNIYNFISTNPGIDIAYGNALYKYSKIVHYGATSLERILLETNLCHQSVFYSRNVFEKIGNYNLKYFLYADWDLNIRCFMHPDFCIKYIDLIVSTYNDTEGMSAKLIDTDLGFLNLLPKYHIESEKKYFLNSREFKIGAAVLKPIVYMYEKLKIKSLIKPK